MTNNILYTFVGDTLNPASDETARIGFIGQERDIEHGYFNMGARYYDPEMGRFLGVDPLFESFKKHSPYSYCFNNPLKMTDASGMSPKGEKRKEQTFGTEIDMKGLNDAYASIIQSRYESSRQPPMIDYIVANRRRNDYYQNVLGKEMYNNMYGGGGSRSGSKQNARLSMTENGSNGNHYICLNYNGKKFYDPLLMAIEISNNKDKRFEGQSISDICDYLLDIYWVDSNEPSTWDIISDAYKTAYDSFIRAFSLTLPQMHFLQASDLLVLQEQVLVQVLKPILY